MTRPIIPPNVLLSGYCMGIFPMADSAGGEIQWYEPKKRAVFPLDAVKASRSLRRTLQKGIFEVRINSAFEATMRACAARRETWISESIIRSYIVLHELHYAHSVESWYQGVLTGGLYGVAIGAAFFGESMFMLKTDASKVAFMALVERMRERGFVLLDAQFMTPHLQSLGAIEISREEYMKQLKRAVQAACQFEG